jgi:hypothetical protein
VKTTRLSTVDCLGRHSVVLVLLATSLAGSLAKAETVTTASLLDEMTNLAGMAEFPSPAYSCKQFSSYDRAARSPEDNWFANGDCGQYLRAEEHAGRQEHVMMDARGPGAIVRIWSANPAGTLRIYIDGAEQPAIEAPMTEVLGGQFPGWPRPIAGEYSKGWNLYFPIPYAKSCRVTSDQGGFYYHVNYRTYAEGTPVESFSRDQLEKLAPELKKLADRLTAPRGDDELGGDAESFQEKLPAGGTVREEFTGPQAFTGIVLRVDTQDCETALRGIILKATFDGEPCIETPLGDFFGSAPGINPYQALPLGMTDDGLMYCHWYMPFKQSAVVELHNTTRVDATLSGEIVLKEHTWTDRSMHFHAGWRSEFDVPTRPMIDWNYLTTRGQGVFAGASFAIDNPVKHWWGEGDEKIYVDGETFPSHFGTGTEDYYGYAWCYPGLFTHAYHSQSRCDGPGNYGRTSVNRFHILDRIPFTKDFKFDMELWHWHDKCKVNLAVTTYWYARPGGTDGFRPLRSADVVVRPMEEYVVPRVPGALEGEELKQVRVTGTAEPQEWDGLSAGRHLWWHAGMKPGDELVVSFPAPNPGKYRVFGHFLRARDYGIHQLAVNGRPAGDPIDFYNPEVQPSSEMELGTFELKADGNELSVKVVGANENAIKAYMFGLDYLLLKPVHDDPGRPGLTRPARPTALFDPGPARYDARTAPPKDRRHILAGRLERAAEGGRRSVRAVPSQLPGGPGLRPDSWDRTHPDARQD